MDPSLFSPLLNVGAVGVVCAWFMLRAEARLKGVERAVNRMSETVLLDILSRSSASGVQEQAAKLLGDIREADKQLGTTTNGFPSLSPR